jgi:hypothetical protein
LLRHPNADFTPIVAAVIEQTQLNFGRVLGQKREINPRTIPSCAQWIGLARPDFHDAFLV